MSIFKQVLRIFLIVLLILIWIYWSGFGVGYLRGHYFCYSGREWFEKCFVVMEILRYLFPVLFVIAFNRLKHKSKS